MRIIPTRVGTSNIKDNFTVNGKDHPHACGDKLYIFAPVGSAIGSSPRVWGQAVRDDNFVKFPRIIPTRVGTS